MSTMLLLSLLLLLLLPPRLQCVKAPSASASTSLSSSSLLSLAANDPEDPEDLTIVAQQANNHNNGLEECKEKKSLKQEQEMVRAKLRAHRCLVRDTAVGIPSPKDAIVEYVLPSHVVVARCTGKEEMGLLLYLGRIKIKISV